MDKRQLRQAERQEATRPGPQTLAAVIVVGLVVYAFYHWTDVKAAIDIFS